MSWKSFFKWVKDPSKQVAPEVAQEPLKTEAQVLAELWLKMPNPVVDSQLWIPAKTNPAVIAAKQIVRDSWHSRDREKQKVTVYVETAMPCYESTRDQDR